MFDDAKVNSVIAQLGRAQSSMRCQELARLLASLGFEVRDGKKAGHKVFVHHGLASFTTGAYTCGHGKNPEIKPVYIKKVAKLLAQYEAELLQYLGEEK